MSSSRLPQLAPTIFITALVASCATPKRIEEDPIAMMRNGDRLESPTRVTDAATTQSLEARIAGHEKRDSLTASAFASCEPPLCAALGRGELSLGMTEAQMFVVTHTTDVAWSPRHSGGLSVYTPRDGDAAPSNAAATLALVQFSGGRIASITYREPQGLRTVATESDVTDANRVRAMALVKEGDALAIAGDFTGALNQYDRASVIVRADADLQYRMATTLDKLLRPIEASLRFRMFLNQLEIQRIDAVGNANAKLSDAIVHARERLVILEKK
jgi:hypothetical protein